MAKGLTDARHYAAIAEVLRKNGADTEGTFQPGEMAQKLQDTCDFRYGEGHNEGYDKGLEVGFREGTEAGRQAEYDRFWDAFQNDGNRRTYTYAFSNTAFTIESFKPKYTITATDNASYMFDNYKCPGIDFVVNGVELDVSRANSLTYLFRDADIQRVGTIDCTGCKDLNRLLFHCSIETIDKFVVTENITYDVPFEYAFSLKNITIEGVIGNSIKFQYCSELTLDSAKSILLSLKNFKGTGNEYTRTISLHANTLSLLDADNTAPGGVSWREYVTQVLCWNI